MARLDVAEILADCVSDVKAGRRTVADCLATCPELAGELEPLLCLARRIEPLPPLKLDPMRKLRARYRFVEALHRERQEAEGLRGLGPFVAALRRGRAVPAIIALALTLALGTGGGVALAAQNAQPGDALYGVKTAVEQVQVAAALSESGKAEARLRIAERRLDEVSKALDRGDAAAAVKAAEGYDVETAEAGKHLAKAQEEREDVSGALSHLAANQEKHRQLLERVMARANGQAQDALALALQHAEQGLANAAGRVQRQGGDVRGPKYPQDESGPRSAEGRLDSGSGAVVQAGGSIAPSAEASDLSSKIGELQAAVLSLANTVSGSKMPGQGYQGLQAKLEAAKASAQGGQTEAALNQLSAFRNQLEAEYQSNHLTKQEYDALLASYNAVAGSVTPGPAAGGDQRSRDRRDGAAQPAPAGPNGVAPTNSPVQGRGNSGATPSNPGGRGGEQTGTSRDRR